MHRFLSGKTRQKVNTLSKKLTDLIRNFATASNRVQAFFVVDGEGEFLDIVECLHPEIVERRSVPFVKHIVGVQASKKIEKSWLGDLQIDISQNIIYIT
ncbi:hypothetical protein [Burkholderia sp. Ac-20344]|uniref:hypothetical protein n=1 Tax=Burkholderia sp. Ac-20344 TaxID=2703890 RepID=UPI00197BDC57|nr:hypothetical protein [Burkholderia sp. Ac-20344]MBN3833775.1 hypothetical protein [Burkholderia sp. Ac-20344]